MNSKKSHKCFNCSLLVGLVRESHSFFIFFKADYLKKNLGNPAVFLLIFLVLFTAHLPSRYDFKH